jgi:hypothetical protein
MSQFKVGNHAIRSNGLISGDLIVGVGLSHSVWAMPPDDGDEWLSSQIYERAWRPNEIGFVICTGERHHNIVLQVLILDEKRNDASLLWIYTPRPEWLMIVQHA